MHAQANRSAGAPAAGCPSGLIRARYALAVCVVCGHEHVYGHPQRARATSCPDCGATVHTFALYRDRQARR
jgi:DNA-directed RNA polymerase subunit RPC12/RpoP